MLPAIEASAQERSGRPLRILHVVESLGSGVTTALEGYIRNTPGHVHTVLAWRRDGAHTGDALDRLAAMLTLPPGRLAQLRSVRRHVAQLRPDVIHAHSSYAGFYVRLLRRPGRSLVFTPHSFSFERRDVPPALRGVFWLTEALLSFRGACVAAVGPREAQLAERLPGRQLVLYVPNVVDDLRLSGAPPGRRAGETGRLRAAAMGRISAQKGPGFFRSAAGLSQQLGLPIDWMWVGGGDPEDERVLREAGVQVTGWSSRSAALGWLSTADVYVHAAAWEGAPMSVLEAAALDLPILARRSAALEALGVGPLYDTPEAIVSAAEALLDERHREQLRACSQRLLERHGTTAQRRMLEHIYAMAAEAARPAPR
jgi:glycosyltransferase involved in cell wall biosynthesis